MNKGIAIFIAGLLMFMVGIYLSTHWVMIGTFLGVTGGTIIGASSYFFANKKS